MCTVIPFLCSRLFSVFNGVLLILLIGVGSLLPNYVYGQYCPSSPTWLMGSIIGEVRLRTLDHNTDGICADYSDFTDFGTVLIPGQSYALEVKLSSCNGFFQRWAKVYIDFNADYDFTDNGEEVGVFGGNSQPQTYTINFTVPANAATEETRMRVSCFTGGSPQIVTPCNYLTPYFGEVEDYTIWISSYADDAGVDTLVFPSEPLCNSDSNVVVNLRNFGTDTLQTVNIHWEVNGIAQSVYSWVGSLASYRMDSVTLPAYPGGFSDGDSISVWVSSPNGSVDSTASNNMATQIVYHGLSGVVEIGHSPTSRFQTLAAAKEYMVNHGICGPVTLKLVDSLYVEQVVWAGILGMNALKTVTITGNGVATKVVMPSGGNLPNYIFDFTNSAYFTLENVMMVNHNPSYGKLVSSTGNSHHISIQNCLFSGVIGTGASGLLNVNGSYNNDWIIRDNEFVHGGYGIYYFGSPNVLGENLVIARNTFVGGSNTAISLTNLHGCDLDENEIKNVNGYVWNGIQLSNISEFNVTRNYVRATPLGYPRNGLNLTNVEGGNSNWSQVAGNRFFNAGNMSGSRGLLAHNAKYVNFIFNSVFLEGTSISVAFEVSGGHSLRVYNNIFQCNYGVAYKLWSMPTGLQMDYNNLSSDFGSIGYFNAPLSTLIDWQVATNLDSNSLSVMHAFSDSSTLRVCTDSLFGKGFPVPDFDVDFDGDSLLFPPQIGADAFQLKTAIQLASDVVICDEDSVELTIPYWHHVIWNSDTTSKYVAFAHDSVIHVQILDDCGVFTDSVWVQHQSHVKLPDVHVCEGKTIPLMTNQNTGNFQWSTGQSDSVIYVDTTQLIWVRFQDSLGCFSSDTLMLNQAYDVRLPDSTFYCSGDTARVAAGIYGAYHWSDQTTDSIYSTPHPGMASITVTDKNCVSMDSGWVVERFPLDPCLKLLSKVHWTGQFEAVNVPTHSDIKFEWQCDSTHSDTLRQTHYVHIYPWSASDSSVVDMINDATLTLTNACGSFTTSGVQWPYDNGFQAVFDVGSDTVRFFMDQTDTDIFWEFGDGQSSTQPNPVHVYPPGYAVSAADWIYEITQQVTLNKPLLCDTFSVHGKAIPLSTPTVGSSSQIHFYPNPVTDELFIELPENAREVSIQVYDIRGVAVLHVPVRQVAGGAPLAVSLLKLSAGPYVMDVEADNRHYVVRITKY